MSDHYHYDDASTHHDHDYSSRYHDHDYAERYHRHYDDERTAAGLREDLGHAEERIRELEEQLANEVRALSDRIAALEPQS